MFTKKIINIVFYKTSNDSKSEKQACIFYEDGTVDNVSFEIGIDACEELVKEHNIKSKNAFQEMINKDLVHVISGKELSERFESFLPSQPVIEEPEESIEVPTAEVIDPETARLNEVFEEASQAIAEQTSDLAETVEEHHEEEPETETQIENPILAEEETSKYETGTGEEDPFEHDEESIQEQSEEASVDGASIDDAIEDRAAIEDSETESGKKGFFARAFEKIKKSKLAKRITAVVTAIGLATTLTACGALPRKSLEGEMLNSNLSSVTSPLSAEDEALIRGNNNYYDSYTYEQLIEVTDNEVQKTAMINLNDTLKNFNESFASFYVESGVNVRASLKFDEMIALQMAYNDYSKKDIQAIFNGADIRSDDLVRAYKDASLQLMGAYAIETSEHPLDMSTLLVGDEAKEFYNKYHAAFLAAKEATGEDQLNKVKEFYAMVKKDFPITQEIRTEGISHSENYEKLVPYKLSVTPMIAAAEMMWQNLEVDNTLQDGEIDFLNDLGLCNYAEETFDRIELITLSSEEDQTNPTYYQYKNAIIEILKENGYYYVDDEHRELTKLQSFQDAVNGHFDDNTKVGTTGPVVTPGGTKTTTTTRQEVETHTETTTTTSEKVTRVEKPIPADVKAKIDAQIAAENEAARKAAEQAAEAERQRLQAIEDEKAKKVIEEVKKDEQDMQQKIEDVNKIINTNNKDNDPTNDRVINESDFGDHGVSFDPAHQDGHGNLNDSVQNITTDPTGDKTNEPLPDPNETGKVFDSKADSYTAAPATTDNITLPSTGQTTIDQIPVDQTTTGTEYIPEDASTAVDSQGNEYQFWVEEEPSTTGQEQWTEVSGVTIDPEYQGYVDIPAQSNEQLVDDYVEGLDGQSDENGYESWTEYGDGYQYTK